MCGLFQLQVPVSSRRGLDLTACSRASAPSGTNATKRVGTAALEDASQASPAPPVNMVCPSLLLSVCQSVCQYGLSLPLFVCLSIWFVPPYFCLSVNMVCPSLFLSLYQYGLSLPPPVCLLVNMVCPSPHLSVCQDGFSLPPSLGCLSVNMVCPSPSCLSVCLSVSMFFPSLVLSVCQYSLSLCLSVNMFFPSLVLSVCQYSLLLCLSVCLSVNMFFSLPRSLCLLV